MGSLEEMRIWELKKQLQEREEDLYEIRSSLRWKIPNFLYKFYLRRIKKHTPRFVFVFLRPLFVCLNRIRGINQFPKREKEEIGKLPIIVRNNFGVEKILDLKIEKVKKIDFEKHTHPEVSIIIPVFNKWQFTYNCLGSLKKNVRNIKYEVIIVDNASTDETQKLFSEKIGNINYIRNEKNLNFVGGNNKGLEYVKGKYVVFLNNDTFVLAGWLESLLDTFQKNKNVGLVGSKLIYPDGTLQEAGGIIWKNKNAWNFGNGKNPDDWEFSYLKDVDYCSAASVMIRTELIQELGGFDSIYQPAFFEDADLAFRIRKLGLRTIFQPKSELIHFEGVTAGKDTKNKKSFKKYQEINKEKFFDRWKDVLAKENFNDYEDNAFLARDRSKNKKVMLYMDNNVPTYDQDAGSFVTLEYLKIFLDLGYKIVFWPHNLQKLDPYVETLQQLGIEVVYGDVSFQDYMKQNGIFFDLAILARAHVAKEYIDLIRKNSQAKIVYSTVDLHYLREEREYKLKDKKEDPAGWKKTKELEIALMKKSDVSLLFSSEEEKIIRKEFPNLMVETIPWIQKVNFSDGQKKYERRGILFLGGFNHTPNMDAVIWFHDKIFPVVKKDLPGVEVTIAGSNPPQKIKELNSDDFKIKGFVPDEDLPAFFGKHKVFVAPLRFGAGFKGKIAMSMSYGLPVVTTSIGAEGMGTVNGESVLIANTAEEFAKAVVRLYKEKEIWNNISKKSIKHVEKSYSAQAAKEKIKEIISKL